MIDTTLPAPGLPPAPPAPRDTWAEAHYPGYSLGGLSPAEHTEGIFRLSEATQLIGSIPDFILSMVRSLLARQDESSRFVLETLRTI